MSKPLNIFLVDDDKIFSVIANITLNKLYEGLNFTCLANGEHALEKIKECADKDMPTILFLDINMPIMGGWDFLEALEKIEQKRFPIYMTSSSIDPKDIQKASEHPLITGFIEKPFDRVEMKALIDSLIAN